MTIALDSHEVFQSKAKERRKRAVATRAKLWNAASGDNRIEDRLANLEALLSQVHWALLWQWQPADHSAFHVIAPCELNVQNEQNELVESFATPTSHSIAPCREPAAHAACHVIAPCREPAKHAASHVIAPCELNEVNKQNEQSEPVESSFATATSLSIAPCREPAACHVRAPCCARRKVLVVQEPSEIEWSSAEPKRPQSVFFLFLAVQRANFDGVLSKTIADEWNHLWKSSAPRELSIYTDVADRMKSQYDAQLAGYSKCGRYKVGATVNVV